jgi:hypothetical protein
MSNKDRPLKEVLLGISRHGDRVRIHLYQEAAEEQVEFVISINQHRGHLQDLRLLSRDLQLAEIAHEVLHSHWARDPKLRFDPNASGQLLQEYFKSEQYYELTVVDLDAEFNVNTLCQENSKGELAELLINLSRINHKKE